LELKEIHSKPGIDMIPGIEVWKNIGVFPTPTFLVDSLIEFILNTVKLDYKTKYSILDLFAGDGRLGLALSGIFADQGINHEVTFIEVNANTIPLNLLKRNYAVLNENVFSMPVNRNFDVIISNPPYLILNQNKAKQLGLSWEDAKLNSRNLFGLSIKKSLEFCKPGGLIAIIAPFGYLKGINSSALRQLIEKECDKIWVRASSERNLFKGVNQDIALQIFIKRLTKFDNKTQWNFAYNGDTFKRIHVALPIEKYNIDNCVKVGPIVWNRKKAYLSNTKENSICLIYGGNISRFGELDLNRKKYKEKQYILRKGTMPTDLISTPFIALRRTVRGKPGFWQIDSTLVTDQTNDYTAENHVITIELPELPINKLIELHRELIKLVYDNHFHSGSPNLSTKIVGKLFSSLIEKFNYYENKF
jgi:tRNA1(Val) A37 N6-methylase TrmN6